MDGALDVGRVHSGVTKKVVSWGRAMEFEKDGSWKWTELTDTGASIECQGCDETELKDVGVNLECQGCDDNISNVPVVDPSCMCCHHAPSRTHALTLSRRKKTPEHERPRPRQYLVQQPP